MPVRDLYQIEIDVAKQYLDNLKSECHREKQRNKRCTNKDNAKCDLFYKHLNEGKSGKRLQFLVKDDGGGLIGGIHELTLHTSWKCGSALLFCCRMVK